MREQMPCDVLIVGAGPAGLATAIRLAQLAKQNEVELEIIVLEKGSEVGAHILSGAVLEPRALDALIPDWRTLFPELNLPVSQDQFYWLSAKNSIRLPTPKPMQNHGNCIISLGNLCRRLAEIAENLGVQIFPGFPASELIIENEKVVGVATQDMGRNQAGEPKESYQPGIELRPKFTVLAEGARGSLSKVAMSRFNLRENCDPQTYGLGVKELWEVDNHLHKPGTVLHTIGWPLDNATYGGSFLYHLNEKQIAIGFVVGLDYANPYLSPYEEFQRFKHHPKIAPFLANGKRLSYGARSLNEGGLQSIPQLHFPGGVLVGCAAGFLNVPKIKGSHTAMQSGIIAAETLYPQLNQDLSEVGTKYQNNIENSWIYEELKSVRNIRAYFRFGLPIAMGLSAIDNYIFRGKTPWTLKHHADHSQLKNKSAAHRIEYPKPDGVLSFDKLSSVQLSGTNHEEDQPKHLKLTDPTVAITTNLDEFDAPETRYCPAGVYEIINLEGEAPRLQINAQNCLHCKACDIKDPTQNITWCTPEGPGGPNYSNM